MWGLRKSYFNLKLGSEKTQIIRVIERPGVWMTEQEKDELRKDLRTVVESMNVGALNYGVVQGSQETLEQAVITMIYEGKTKRPIAFNALTFMNCTIRGVDVPVLHLGLIVIDPSVRAKGISWILYGMTSFLLFLKNGFRPLWVSNVTQVPAIVGKVAEGFSRVYPNPFKEERRSYDHLVLAREMMSRHRSVFGVGEDAEFDETNFVIRNAYTGGSDNLKKTWEEAPKHRHENVNQFVLDRLDYKRGDDILQLGQMDVTSFYNYVMHSIPNESKLKLIYHVGFGLIESYLVPFVQWFMVWQPMGHLRVRKGWRK